MKQLTTTICTVAVAFFGVACGGSQSHVDSAHTPQGAPDWVNRGSVVSKRVVFGVGLVKGVKNPALARDTAAGRGRAEISRILETYSASLIKDYSASTSAGGDATSEEQHVEQAVKTFSANLMTGSEIVNQWVSPTQGVLYVLVQLDFDKQAELAAAKADMGSMKDWVDKNGGRILDDLEGGMKPTPPAGGDDDSPEVAAGDPPQPPAPPVAPPASAGPAPKVGGPAPGWTKGQCDRNAYLCGLGDGSSQDTADNDARAELGRIFESYVQAVVKSFDGASRTISSATGENWIEMSSVSQMSMVSTNKVVTMSEIADRWADGKGQFFTLAVIDRAKASTALREQIQAKDSEVGSALAAAKAAGDDKLKRLKSLKIAVRAFVARETMNSDLRVIRTDGKGIPSPHKMSDLLAFLDDAASDLSFGLALAGGGSESLRGCLEEALTARGYQINANVDEDEDEVEISGDFDVIIKGKVRSEKRGKIRGADVVKTTLELKLINGKTKKILRSITDSEKGTRGSVKAAASTSVVKICKRKIPEMVKDIDRYFGK